MPNALLLSTHYGSIEHPYHFWLAYYLPACEWLIDNPDAKGIKMIECGPMTNWIEHLQQYRDIEIIKPITALNVHLSGNYNSVVFSNYDYPENFEKVGYFSRIDEIKKAFFNVEPSTITIGLLQRNPGLPFYNSKESEAKTSGSERRTISNLLDIKPILDQYGSTEIIDSTTWTAQDSVNKYSGLSCLVGQFGAGLTNMVWMKKGSTVIELRSIGLAFSKVIDDCYKMLAERLGLNFISVVAQKDWHGEADINLIKNTIKNIYDNNGLSVKSM